MRLRFVAPTTTAPAATTAATAAVARERIETDRAGQLFIDQVVRGARRQDQMADIVGIFDDTQFDPGWNLDAMLFQDDRRFVDEPLLQFVIRPGLGHEHAPLLLPIALL